MKSFDYIITDTVGLHARPAGLLVKEARTYGSIIKVINGKKSAEATKLMSLMGLGIKRGDTVTVSVEGGNEDAVASKMEDFFKSNL